MVTSPGRACAKPRYWKSKDRPYKKAVPPEPALEILDMSVQNRELDRELFELFVRARTFRLTLKRSTSHT